MLASVLPAELVAALDLTRLELVSGASVSDGMEARYADLLYRAPLREADPDVPESYVYIHVDLRVLVEHQSGPDQRMPLRSLDYMHRFWAQLLRDEPGRKTLPPIVMVVVHHGPSPMQPVPKVAMWLLRDRRHVDALVAHIGAWKDAFNAVMMDAPDVALVFLRYISVTTTESTYHEVRRIILENVPAAEAPMATIADGLKQLGLREGLEKGRQEGRQEGEQRGRVEALRDVLRLLLTQRFGCLDAACESRIAAAEIEALHHAITHVAVASEPADVFARH